MSLYVLLFAKCALAPSHIVTPHNLQNNRDPRGNIHGRDIEIHETASRTLARISVKSWRYFIGILANRLAPMIPWFISASILCVALQTIFRLNICKQMI